MFALFDDQLGGTSLVQHTIDTGDAMPVKQRPYLTTPENKQEIDRQVNDMLQRRHDYPRVSQSLVLSRCVSKEEKWRNEILY